MPRRLHNDLSDSDDADTRRRGNKVSTASDKDTLADLRATAVFIVAFTERDRQILKAWLNANAEPKVAGLMADCPAGQVYNILRKLKREISKLKSRGRHLPLRLDIRKSRRILERAISRSADERLLRAFKADPLRTACDAMARQKAARKLITAGKISGPCIPRQR
jgi:hypothetical protein